MAIGFFIDPLFYLVGTGGFLNSFFSTIFVKLENSNWGSRFPIIMNNLFDGSINKEDVTKAIEELTIIKQELSKLCSNEIIWDYENLGLLPPWGNNMSTDVKNMSDYFVTSDGKNLLTVLEKALISSQEIEENVIIKSL